MRSFLTLALAFGVLTTMATADDHECALNFKAKTIDGKTVDLEDYEGNVVLVVNTASQCGLTPQYAGLEKLYAEYKDDGLVILGFPCNQFGRQEPGSDADIKKFCSSKYKVTFPMFSKIDVNGDEQIDSADIAAINAAAANGMGQDYVSSISGIRREESRYSHREHLGA